MTRHKYGAIAVEIDGHKFPSKREAKRYGELKMLEKAGHIGSLELQPSFDLHVAKFVKNCPPGIRGAVRVCRYVADFRYIDHRAQKVVVEDAKGMKTPVYRLKRKMVEIEYGIEVIEV